MSRQRRILFRARPYLLQWKGLFTPKSVHGKAKTFDLSALLGCNSLLLWSYLKGGLMGRWCGLWAPSRMPLYLVSLFIRVSLIFTEKLHFPVLISLCSLFNLQETSRDIRILSLYITFLTFRLLFSIKTRNQNGNAGPSLLLPPSFSKAWTPLTESLILVT